MCLHTLFPTTVSTSPKVDHPDLPKTNDVNDAGYRIVPNGTKRQQPLLVDPSNYKYQIDKSRANRTYWRCCTRSTTGCGATVVQIGDHFTPGRHQHVEVSHPGSFEAASIRSCKSYCKLCKGRFPLSK